jgi:hypothetical protein
MATIFEATIRCDAMLMNLETVKVNSLPQAPALPAALP